LDQVEKMSPNLKSSHSDEQNLSEHLEHLQAEELPKASFETANSSCENAPEVDFQIHHLEDAGEKPAATEQDKPKGHPLSIEDFLHRFEQASSPEEKLQEAIGYMRATLSQQGTPFFKGFWEARQRCIPLFKENLAAQSRTDFWNEYRELCQESRRLKEILDEQSAFAAEQIEIAIKALETDLEQFSDQLKRMQPLAFPFPCETLKSKHEIYNHLQNELNLLNTHASRINALRKELIKTDMRIRVKNKFFRQLSAAGDHVFPRRKELIKSLSGQFLEDVDAFVKSQFSNEFIQSPLFFLREEIKALQAIAKILTLNTYSFTQTRTRLSECWDKIKDLEKERKKVRVEQRAASKENAEQVSEKIEHFRNAIEKGEINIANLNQEVDELYNFMHSLQLGRDEKLNLREQINKARQPLLEKIKQDEEARQSKEHELDRLRNEKLKELKARVHNLIEKSDSLNADEIVQERDHILEEIQTTTLLKAEKQNLERSLKPLKDVITDKKEKAILALPEDDLESLEQLKVILKQRKERRKEIKERLEEYRKASGASSLDFEKAIAFNQMLHTEKERLEKINQGIKEIEHKIKDLESKAK
jgi:hypothetical protein